MAEASRDASSPRRRAGDLIALALVAASVGLVSASAVPSLARELGLTRASLSRRDAPRDPHGELIAPQGARSGRSSPHAPIGIPDLVAPPDEDEEQAPDARLAVTVRDVVVRDRADDRATSLAKVGAGELLIVIREAGAWAMVAHLGEEGSTTGWVRRGDLAIR